MAAPKAAALYVRISLDRTGEGVAVERQEAEARAWAAKQGWVIAEVYPDNDTSASKGLERPHFNRMLEDLQSGKRDAILVWALDRLARDMQEVLNIMKLEPLLGTVTQGVFDLAQPSSQLFMTFLGGYASFEVKHKGTRHKAEIRQAAYAGKPVTHKRPFGWTDRHMQTLHPKESELIQGAAKALLEGASVRGLVVKWNKAGIKTSAGGAWHRVTIKQLMSRWSNAAIPVHLGEPLMDVQGQWKPILGRDTLLAVRAITSPGGTQFTAAKSYLLSGILKCAKDDKPMVANKGRYWCSHVANGLCSQTISPHLVENRVIANTLIQAYAHSQKKLEEQSTKERLAVEQELGKLRARQKNVQEDTDMDENDQKAILKALRVKLGELQEQALAMVQSSVLDSLLADLVPLGLTSKARDQLEALETLQARWEDLDFAQKRLLIRSFGEYRIHPGRGSSRLEVLPMESP